MSFGSNSQDIKICFLASGGGHFQQICQLGRMAEQYEHFLITIVGNNLISDHCSFKRIYLVEEVGSGFWKKKPGRMIHVLVRMFRIFQKEKPNLVISTGSGIAVPGFLLAKLFNIKLIYIEAYARISSLSLTGKICYRLADLFIVQHSQLINRWPRALYGGSLYEHLPGDTNGICNGRK